MSLVSATSLKGEDQCHPFWPYRSALPLLFLESGALADASHRSDPLSKNTDKILFVSHLFLCIIGKQLIHPLAEYPIFGQNSAFGVAISYLS